MAKKRARDTKIKSLTEKMKVGGVKGLTAKTELMAIENEDLTEMNRVEITLEAAKRRHARNDGGGSAEAERERLENEKKRMQALQEQLKHEQEQRQRRCDESRARLMARAAAFEN